MGKQAELDADLASALKAAKTKRHFFAVVLKGSSDGALIVSKQKIGPAKITEAKKESGGSTVLRGVVHGEDGKLVFETDKEPPATLAKTLKTIAQRDAGLMIQAVCKLGVDPDTLPDNLDGDAPKTTSPTTTGTTQPGNGKTAPPTGTKPMAIPKLDLAGGVKKRLEEITPEYSQAIGHVGSEAAGKLKALRGAIDTCVSKSDFGNALKFCDKLEQETRLAVSQSGQQQESVDLPDDLSDTLAGMFDEESEEFKYRAKREEVMGLFPYAVKFTPQLQSQLDGADKKAEAQDYEAGTTALEKLLPECDKAIAAARKSWLVKEREFSGAMRLGKQLATQRAKKVAALEEDIFNSNSSNRVEAAKKAQKQLDELNNTPDIGGEIGGLYKQANEAATDLDFIEAQRLVNEAIQIARPAQEQLNQALDNARRDTERASAADEKAFDFASKTKDKKWGFDSDDDARNFLIGNAMGQTGNLVKSEKLKEMEGRVAEAVKRKDILLASGASPEEVGETVFKNIPRNFWPDSFVREVIMYQRARADFEAEKVAAQTAQEEDDIIDNILEGEESGMETANSLVKKVSKAMDPKTVKDLKEKSDKLGELGFEKIAAKGGKALSSEQLKQAGEFMKDFAEGFGYVADGVGVLVKGAQAVKLGIEAHKIKDDPVKQKLVEFQRNKAIIDAVNKMIDIGLGLDDIVPGLKVASGGKEMVMETIKAVQYFVRLAEIAGLKENAKLDPETMMDLPLARMARNQKVRASKATIAAVTALIQTVGAAGELGGISAPAGTGLRVTGKLIELGSKVVFKGIDWADARRCVKTMKAAAGPPPIRKAMTMIFKNSTKYATYALAFGAVEGHDPWAIAYVVGQGLTEDDLKSPATSIQIVREYMLTTAGGLLGDEDKEEDDPTIRPDLDKPGLKDKAIDKFKAGAAAVRDKIIGRDTSKPYNAAWRAPSAELSRKNWTTVKPLAVAAGWYDARSGLGDVLAVYETGQGAFDKGKSIETGTALCAALRDVRSALGDAGTFANDEKTAHVGMIDYLDQLSTMVDIRLENTEKSRSELIDVSKFGNVSPEELKTLKQEALDKAVEEHQAAVQEKIEVRQREIKTYWDGRKHKTPYGSSTLGDFALKATKELGLDEREMWALAGATIELSEDCVRQLTELLSAVPPDKFKKEMETQANKLDETLVEGLRTIATLHFEAMQQRLGDDAEDSQASDGQDWQATNFALSSGAWEGVKKDAIKNGLVDNSTGIGAALKTLEKAETNYQKNKDDEKNVRLVVIALNKVEEAFRKFKPLNRKKLTHAGMAGYRGRMLAKIKEYQLSFQNERKSKEQAKQGEAPKPDWAASDFSMTKKSWETMKEEAIAEGLVDKKTGLGDAFSLFEKAKTAYDKETEPKKKDKAKNVLVKAVDNLEKKLTGFTPTVKSGLPMMGMQHYRAEMLKNVREYRTTASV